MKYSWPNDQRGSALLFTTVMLVLLLVFGGIATDLMYFGSVRRELQRSMDAAALAGAGNLGFNETAFPAARAAAQNYAGLNGYSNSEPAARNISMTLNTANDSNGQIVLGIWDGANFAPSLDGTRVNAVRCQFATNVPTSFLRLLGLDSLPVSAEATAVANPPLLPADGTCVFPIALSGCAFTNAGSFTSQGCGAPATFISSSGRPPGTTAGTNTGAWANMCGTSTPSAPQTRAAINSAATGACTGCAPPEAGTTIGTNNGMQQSVFDFLEQKFVEQFNRNQTYQVTDINGNTTYSGRGWKVFVPVIETACPPGPINGPHRISGWSEMVITQVYNRGNGCAVRNPADTNSWSLCPQPMNPSGPARADPNLRAVFGRYKCTLVKQVATRLPAPRSALGTQLRLVQ